MRKDDFRIRSRHGIERLSDNVFLNKYLLEHLYTSLHMVVCMCCHECETHQCVLWSTCGWYHGVDENSIVESQPSDHESLVNVANVQRNNRAFRLANLETLLAETSQRVIGHIPQAANALRLVLNNVQSLYRGSRGGRRVAGRENVCAACVP